MTSGRRANHDGARHRASLSLTLSFGLAVLLQAGGLHAAPTDDPAGSAPSERPVVQVGVLIADLVEVDDRGQAFVADLVFSARWQDPRLADGTARRLPLDDVWHPELTVLNERAMRRLFREEVFVSPEGEVLYRQRVFGSLGARLDLHEYPFDRQRLEIRLIAALPTGEIELRVDPERTGRLGEFSALGWRFDVTEPKVEMTMMEAIGRRMPLAVVAIDAERERAFFHYSVFLPLVLLVLMAWTVFWIDENLVASQIGVTTAAVFSIIAFRLSLRLMLPPVSYMTRVDIYVLGATLLVFASLGVAILVGRLVRLEKATSIRRVQVWGRWIFLAAFMALTATALRW